MSGYVRIDVEQDERGWLVTVDDPERSGEAYERVVGDDRQDAVALATATADAYRARGCEPVLVVEVESAR